MFIPSSLPPSSCPRPRTCLGRLLLHPLLPLLLRGELGMERSVDQGVEPGVKRGGGRIHLAPLGIDLLKYVYRCPMLIPNSLPGGHPSGA